MVVMATLRAIGAYCNGERNHSEVVVVVVVVRRVRVCSVVRMVNSYV